MAEFKGVFMFDHPSMRCFSAILSVIALGGFFIFSSAAVAEQIFPGPDWRDQPDQMASSDAIKGGEVIINLGPSPKSFNYYLDTSFQGSLIFGNLYESLLSMDPTDFEYEPALARKWTISNDKKTFTFQLDPAAMWSDGRPITAHDVKWTYEAIMDPGHLTGPHKIDLERFEPPEVLDDRTIRFRAKTVHWQNLGAAGGMLILPKHAYEKLDFNKINFEFPVVSGPYRLGRHEEGIFLNLERRPDWWAGKYIRHRHTNNFDVIKFKFFAERENALEAFKKGTIDIYPVNTARFWVKETKGERFEKNWIVKQKIFNNHMGLQFQGFAMNMRRAPFDDRRVRKAINMLVDRHKMNRTIMYSQYEMLDSYYTDLYDKSHPCPNEPIKFDKAAARKLLKEAGWRANPATGFLEKGGSRFTIRFLTRDASTEKFLSIFAEDLKDAGIELVIDRKDWAAWAKDMDEFNYQMTWAAWGAPIFKNPESSWSSKEADRRGGTNITGFKDAEVDRLIEEQKRIFDVRKRNDIYRRIDHIIYKEFPYVLLWGLDYTRLLYWNKFGTPEWVLPKNLTEYSALIYWWLDPDSEADLEDAVNNGYVLPPRPSVVRFDDVFPQ
jgi:microcin C transport system substrate-binding protein